MAFVVTAVATAIEVGTIAAVATAVTQVGIAMSVVGVVTKSKELTRIGGVLSIAGGVTSLANAAGLFGEAAAAGSAGAAATKGATEFAGDNILDAASQATADQYAAGAADVANNITADSFVGGASSAADQAIGAGAGIGSTSEALKTGYDLTGGASAAGNAAGPTTAAGATGFTPPTPVATGAMEATAQPGLVNQATSMQVGADVAPLPAAQATAAIPKPGLFDDPKAWFKSLTPDQQSRVSTALLQTGGQAVGGLFQGWSAEQKLALEKEAMDLQKQRYEAGVKTANAMPVIAFKPVGLVSGATKG